MVVVFTIPNKEKILVERAELDRRNKWSGITRRCQNFPLTELLQTNVEDLLDIISLSLKDATLTDPLLKSRENAVLRDHRPHVFIGIPASFRPSFLPDTFMITSKPSHEQLLFLLLDKLSV